jgi:hypothetical protein
MPQSLLSQHHCKSLTRFIVLSAFLFFLPLVGTGQNTLQEKVLQAINLPFPDKAVSTRSQLTELGPAAAPYIVEAIRSRDDLHAIRKTFLIDTLAGMCGTEIEDALLRLLSDNDPYVRGLTTTYLAKRKLTSSIPYLINLLNDQGVYKTINQTDPPITRDILVRDVAIDALEATTKMVLAPKGSRGKQAQAWLQWWRKQEKSQRKG